MKTYKFIGQGLGVPNLPHVITETQAKQLGVVDLLKQAVNNGSYQEIEQTAAVLAPVENTGKKSVKKSVKIKEA